MIPDGGVGRDDRASSRLPMGLETQTPLSESLSGMGRPSVTEILDEEKAVEEKSSAE